MAASLSSNLNFLVSHPSMSAPIKAPRYMPIQCGPRSNRGPLLKGRVLSIEAIQAIQALKRAHRADPAKLDDVFLSKTLSRLLKADLVASFNELLRQDQSQIAVKVFSAIQSEYNVELSLYGDLISSLARRGFTAEIDELVCDLERKGSIQSDEKGLVRLVKALIEAERLEYVVRIYELMKKSGWGSTLQVDEYVAKVLSKGFRRMGESSLADEIDAELKKIYKSADRSKSSAFS